MSKAPETSAATPSAKKPAKSPRRRAREFALQGLYQWRVGGNDEAAIEAHLAGSDGFDKADREFFVGLLRGTVNKDGEDMVNIGAVMEYGATIKHPNGATIIIPARPFLHPVMEKYREQILQNYREAIRSAL